jgi:hypothetical protein
MHSAAILAATARFALWEFAVFAAAIALARLFAWRSAAEYALAVLAIQVTLESSAAAMFSFARINSTAVYWAFAAICLAAALAKRGRPPKFEWGIRVSVSAALMAALTVPLIFLAFHPVEEIDSINYLHYLLDWMANRATPYTFATNYVAFWELSFLPCWIITKVDLFFPLLALKAVVLLAIAAWLAGRELGLRGRLLLWTVYGAVVMRHFWVDFSGVPTLKNDALHGAGFVLLTLAVIRAAKKCTVASDFALLAFGAAFSTVKYTGIFTTIFALALVWLFQRGWRWVIPVIAFVLLTGGHYYLHNLFLYGSPFYPFQINFGPIHLPGTADLSATSILYSLRYPALWQAFFLPAGGLSPAGLLFPLTLFAGLAMATWTCARWAARRKRPGARQVAALMILCGWLLYFRSVYSAGGSPGDLIFLRNALNSIRYVDGVLAVTELFLISLLAPFEALAAALTGVNIASRLFILYSKLSNVSYSQKAIWLSSAAGFALALLQTRKNEPKSGTGADPRFLWRVEDPEPRTLALGPQPLLFAALILIGPFLVEHRRAAWTSYWNDLKPALAAARPQGLAELALPDAGYYAGHAVAAGNPADPNVRSVELSQLASAGPHYVAVLITPGSAPDWQSRYVSQLAELGYRPVALGRYGALFERDRL